MHATGTLEQTPLTTSSAHALLTSAPGGHGKSACVILRCGSSSFVWQRKTVGYPFANMVGALSLFGGGQEGGDVTAKHTLERELREEVPVEWLAGLEIKPLGRYVVLAPALAVAPRMKGDYGFLSCVYYGEVKSDVVLGTKEEDVLEGKFEVIALGDLVNKNTPVFAWGYDLPFMDYVEKVLKLNMEENTCAARMDYHRCRTFRIEKSADMGEWAHDEDWAL